jgi:hypothetical protein
VRSLFWNDLRFMSSINVLGLPAAVVPVGFVAGNPVAVQLIGSRYREDLSLDAAAAIEAKVGIMAKRLWNEANAAGRNTTAKCMFAIRCVEQLSRLGISVLIDIMLPSGHRLSGRPTPVRHSPVQFPASWQFQRA